MHKIHNISANLHSVNVMEATQDMIDNLSQELTNIFIEPAKTTECINKSPLALNLEKLKILNHGSTPYAMILKTTTKNLRSHCLTNQATQIN